MVMSQATKNRISWDNGDPATPALIEPMLDDERGLDRITDETMKEAIAQTIGYCKARLRFYAEGMGEHLTMGDMSDEAQHFLNGYMAAKTGKIEMY